MPETKICQYYPPWFRRILDFQALCHTEGMELEAMADAMHQIHENLFVQTMDEKTTEQWEKILNIMPSPEESLEFRRLRVQNRIALRPPFTMIFLREKLDLLFGPGNYEVEVDYPNYTLYIESTMDKQDYFTEVSALLNIVKPCHIVYIARPRLDSSLLLSERVGRGQIVYHYILGQWRLGEKPFATFEEEEVLKLETTHSIQPPLLNHTAAFVASDVASARVNGEIVVTTITRAASGNIGSVMYPVHRTQAEEITLSELVGKDGNVLSSSQVYVKVLDETIMLRHSFAVKEEG